MPLYNFCQEQSVATLHFTCLSLNLHVLYLEHNNIFLLFFSRVTFYASLFSSLFGAEYVFHSEQGKVVIFQSTFLTLKKSYIVMLLG